MGEVLDDREGSVWDEVPGRRKQVWRQAAQQAVRKAARQAAREAARKAAGKAVGGGAREGMDVQSKHLSELGPGGAVVGRPLEILPVQRAAAFDVAQLQLQVDVEIEHLRKSNRRRPGPGVETGVDPGVNRKWNRE